MLKKLRRYTRRRAIAMDLVDENALAVATAVIALADNADNLEDLSKLTASLHYLALGSDAYSHMKTSLYLLDEYVDLKCMKLAGKAINEEYLAQLREDLLSARL
jgi:hypothetical protein